MLPEKFSKRMKDILGDEYTAFSSALEEKSIKGIRVNESKIAVDDFLKITSLPLSEIEYSKNGFIPENSEGIGNTPEHHAGMFYVQDPGAMATVNALDIKRGWHVLDACSAPGGKSSQIASLIGDEGFLIANEYVPKRAKIVVQNFERLGIKNAAVVSYDTALFKQMFANFFDLVLCDAPCSGEGMFRKHGQAITEWNEENVILSAQRQKEILNNIAPLIKKGGYLLYSTCTYSPEENEDNVASFLSTHRDYELCPVNERILSCTVPGIVTEGLTKTQSEMCRRFYPHISKGEGQFVALMQRIDAEEPQILFKDESRPLSKAEEKIVRTFLCENMKTIPGGKLVKQGDYAVLSIRTVPLPRFSVFMSGVVIGEIKKDRLEPHHQFFSAYGKKFKNTENIKKGDVRIEKYLRGEEIEAKESKNGFCAVLYENVALGGGKCSGGKIKNHYPKGLRIKH